MSMGMGPFGSGMGDYSAMYDPNDASASYAEQQAGKAAKAKAQADGLPGVGQYYNPETGYDPSDYLYGGQPGMEQQESGYYRGLADQYRNRQAPTLDYGNANDSRNSQVDALGLMRGAAMGQAPSVAAIQQQQGLNQAMGMQMSAAASARGGGPAQALAARTAMANGADMQQAGVSNAAMLRAQEMAEARGQFMGGATSMRGADENRAQYAGDLEMRNRGLNDQSSYNYENMRRGVIGESNQARQAKQDLLYRASRDAQSGNAQIAAQNAAQDASDASASRDRWEKRAGSGIAIGGNTLNGYMGQQGAGSGGSSTPTLDAWKNDPNLDWRNR